MSSTACPRRTQAQGFARLAGDLHPGARVCGIQPLHGGLDARVHRFELVSPGVAPRRLVLRRYRPRTLRREPGIVDRAWQTLVALEALGIAAPQPILLDAKGTAFGTPALVMTLIDGSSLLSPGNLDVWLGELAAALAALHRTSIDEADLSFLPGPGVAASRLLALATSPRSLLGQRADRDAVARALRVGPAPAARPALVHGDFWPGNTVWSGGKVAAIVDWDSAAVDDPALDVGYCRMDLAMLFGGTTPARFLQCYEEIRGGRLARIWFWDLLAAVRALPDPARWLPGYHRLGRRDVDAGAMRRRLDAFIAEALRRAVNDAR